MLEWTGTVAGILGALFAIIALPAIATDIRSCVSQREDCVGLIVAEIGTAKREVLVQAYNFANAPIETALADAKRRGVDVRVTDENREPEGVTDGVGTAPVQIGRAHSIRTLNEFMVLDGDRVITGNFNIQVARERNTENMLVIHDGDLAGRYAENWWRHAGHSEQYDRR